MNQLLQPEIQDFITKNIDNDINKLSLSKNPFSHVDYKLILNQIEAKQKARTKLPTWFSKQNIIFPSKLSIEQTSSESTAQFKSKLITGNSIIDLTGGFGIDCYYFSKEFKNVIHCEINEELSEIVKHNASILQQNNLSCYAKDGFKVLSNLNQKFDWIYVDPSRRNDVKGKVFLLKDCLPDVTVLLDEYLKYTDKILIKNSPIYDISVGLQELHSIKTIHIVALENEVKELLIEIHKNYNESIEIKTVNLTKNENQLFDFSLDKQYNTKYSLPKSYLFEPNASIMKSQGFDALSEKFGIDKLHKHSHLFTSDNDEVNFPGRRFKINQILLYKKQEMKQFIQGKKINISTRNFPETVAQLKQKWKIQDGGNQYCFFTTDINNDKIVVFCDKF